MSMRARGVRPVVAAAAVTLTVILVTLYANGGPGRAPAVRGARRGTSGATASDRDDRVVSVWVSVTNVDRGHMLSKFRKFFGSLVGRRGRCRAAFELNVIADNVSRAAVDGVVDEFAATRRETHRLTVNTRRRGPVRRSVCRALISGGPAVVFAAGPLRFP